MQNKLYTIQFSHHLTTSSQTVPKHQLWNPEHAAFANFTKFTKIAEMEKFELPEKCKLLDKKGFEPTENRLK